jgi:ABC-type Fe3+/spermidine/putrescine transport system ATPase subunit
MTAIEFQNVSKHNGDRLVLSDLSFQIEQGERVSVQGPSGSGKTTMLRLLAGFLAPGEGEIWIGDRRSPPKESS